MKFDLTTHKELTIAASPTFLTTAFDSAQCICDNVVLEAHFNVYFEDGNVSEPSNAYVIKEILIDVVYGKTRSDACVTPKHY